MSLQAALDAYQRQDFATARTLLAPVLAAEPDNEYAWTLQMYVAASEAERTTAMQRVLALNPRNPQALALQKQAGKKTPTPGQKTGQKNQEADQGGADDGAVYEMLWDCAFCGTTKLLGKTHRFCPNCGGAQDAKARYFPSDEEKIAVKDHRYTGVDKLCTSCGTPNAGRAEFCMSCGAPLSDAPQAQRLTDEIKAADETFDRSGKPDQNGRTAAQQALAEAAAARRRRNLRLLIAGGMLLLSGIAVLFLWTQEISVTTTGHRWQRSISIEDFAARSKGDWCDSLPRDAYSVSRSQKERSQKQIADGEECSTRRVDQGDGTYRERQECRTKYRSEPVYDSYCHYRVNRWDYVRQVKAQGSDQNPHWPTYQLRCSGERLGCEREGKREAEYWLLLKNPADDKSYECAQEETPWKQVPVNTRWQLEIGAVTGGAHCGSLTRKD